MTVNEETRALAAATAAEIRRRGWVQGAFAEHRGLRGNGSGYRSSDCKVCILGGLGAAFEGDPLLCETYSERDWPPAVTDLANKLVDGIPPLPDDDPFFTTRPGALLARWNDTAGRTVDEVLALLDSVAGE